MKMRQATFIPSARIDNPTQWSYLDRLIRSNSSRTIVDRPNSQSGFSEVSRVALPCAYHSIGFDLRAQGTAKVSYIPQR
jgi:hypothetical protein